MDSFPPAKLATAVEGFEPEQQKKQQSYFVRLGSLSAKLQHRALQHSLGKLQSARSSSHDVLGQLQRALDLVGPSPSPPPPLGWGQPPTPCFSPAAGGASQARRGPEAAGRAGEAAAAVVGVEHQAARRWQGVGATSSKQSGAGGVPRATPVSLQCSPHLLSPRRRWSRVCWPCCRAWLSSCTAPASPWCAACRASPPASRTRQHRSGTTWRSSVPA